MSTINRGQIDARTNYITTIRRLREGARVVAIIQEVQFHWQPLPESRVRRTIRATLRILDTAAGASLGDIEAAIDNSHELVVEGLPSIIASAKSECERINRTYVPVTFTAGALTA